MDEHQEILNWCADHAEHVAGLLQLARDILMTGESTPEKLEFAVQAIALVEPKNNKMRAALRSIGAVSSTNSSTIQARQEVLDWKKRIADFEAQKAQMAPQREPETVTETEYNYARGVRLAADYRKQLLLERGKADTDETFQTLNHYATIAEKRVFDSVP